MLIKAEKLTKIYGSGKSQVVALKEADLEIAQGEFVSIMGSSGSGKSTLLHLLSGLDRPTSGSLFYDIKNLSGRFRRTEALPEQKSAEVSMEALPEQQSAEVYLEELAELLGIKDRLTHLPHELSGGQQQRVAIARALIARPDVIFVNEPTGSLDSKSGGEVMRMLEEIRQKMEKGFMEG